MTTSLRALILEDYPDDAELLVEELRRAGFEPVAERVVEEQAFRQRLASRPDVVLADYTIPGFGASRALEIIHESQIDVPVIVLTGSVSDDAAVECMRQGAADYLLKDRLARLGPAVNHALASYRARRERREALAEMEASEARYRAICELTSDFVYASFSRSDIGFVCDWVAGAFTEITGYDPDELQQPDAWLMLAHPDDREAMRHHWRRILGGDIDKVELRIITKQGQTRVLHLSGRPERDPRSGRIVGFSGAARDTTERARVEEELAQAQKLESVGRLAAGIAHEINTPIQFIGDNMHFLRDSFASMAELVTTLRQVRAAAEQGAVDAELLAESLAAEDDADIDYLADEVPRAIEQTLDGVDRVATIVRAMKEFAHPDQGECIAVDLNHALSSTLIVARNELKYVADVHADLGALPPVVCQPGAINQVFLNLLVNAAHAIADKPDRDGERGLINIKTAQQGDQALVAISDTGGGIPDAIRSKIFEQFFTTKGVGRGTGQGLPLARRVVEQHGGSLTFETEVGRGTTFYVRLPINGPAGGSEEQQP